MKALAAAQAAYLTWQPRKPVSAGSSLLLGCCVQTIACSAGGRDMHACENICEVSAAVRHSRIAQQTIPICRGGGRHALNYMGCLEASGDMVRCTNLAPILHQAVTEALAEGGSLREQLLRGQESADLCQTVVGCLPHEAVGVQQGLEQEHMQLCIQLWGEGGAHGRDNELQRLQDTAL